MIDWNGATRPDPREAHRENPVHMTVHQRGNRMEVEFVDRDGVLATMHGRRTREALAWILAAITEPFPTVITEERN